MNILTVTTFNNKFYATNRLSTSSILVDGGIPSLTVRAFANGDLAMQYVVDARSNPEFLTNVKGFICARRIYYSSKIRLK